MHTTRSVNDYIKTRMNVGVQKKTRWNESAGFDGHLFLTYFYPCRVELLFYFMVFCEGWEIM